MKKIVLLIIIIVIIIAGMNWKNILKCFYKTDYSEYVEKYASEFNIDKWLVYSIIKAESNFNVGATSSKGASRSYATYGQNGKGSC